MGRRPVKANSFSAVPLLHKFTNVHYVELMGKMHTHQCFFAGTSMGTIDLVPAIRMKIMLGY